MSKEPMNSFVGKWALITGASSGLGLDFADLLAAQKVNLVLAAKRGRRPRSVEAGAFGRPTGSDEGVTRGVGASDL
jgi:uncharacterized protein